MDVFISWSGEISKKIAMIMSEWIKYVLQATEPWMSSKDIDRGSIWFNNITDQLKNTRMGIICLTQDNKDSPWILFEAGALMKGLAENHVCTFLIDLKPEDIKPPLAQFNHTMPNKNDLFSLINTLNSALASPLDDERLKKIFDTYWTFFYDNFNSILSTKPQNKQGHSRSEKDILVEILEGTRALSNRIGLIERRIEIANIESANFLDSPKTSLRMLRNQIQHELENGTSKEMIFQKYSKRYPPEWLDECLYKANRS